METVNPSTISGLLPAGVVIDELPSGEQPRPAEMWPTRGLGWARASGVVLPRAAVSASAWVSPRLLAISAIEHADYPDGQGAGLQWHISISAHGKRAPDKLVMRALKAFRLVGAEEDNHEPGNARHFWMPMDPAHRVNCECKETEVVVVERNGHVWSNDPDPSKCRGCVLQRMIGKPCSIHSAT